MKVFLASARLDDIRWATNNGLADGVVITPALLETAGAQGDTMGFLDDLCRAVSVPVCVSVGSVNEADILRDGRELVRLSDHIIVQVPLVEDAVPAIRRLSLEGVRVCATLVFNAAQATLAAKAGASTVSVSTAQLDAQGQDAAQVLSEIRALFDRHHVEGELRADLPRSASQFSACALAGADSVTLDFESLRAFLLHPLTDRGVDQFLSELSKRPKGRTPA